MPHALSSQDMKLEGPKLSENGIEKRNSSDLGGRETTEKHIIITERIIRDKDNIERFFREKSEALSNIAKVDNDFP
jgi:hypothetical protein